MNRRTVFLFVLSLCAAAFVQGQINAPKVGVARYPDETLHIVYGIPANYIVDGQALASADAASFSDAGGIVAKNGSISLLGPALKTIAEYQSGEAAPLLNIDGNLNSAIVWLPKQRALLRWNGTSFVLTQVNGLSASAAVSSVYLAGANTVKLLLANPEATASEASISLDSGELTSLDALPGIRAPAIRQQSFFVFRDDHGLAIATSTAVIETFPLPGLSSKSDLTFERMSSNAVHVMSASTGQNWVLHIGNPISAQLFLLPGHSTQVAVTEPAK